MATHRATRPPTTRGLADAASTPLTENTLFNARFEVGGALGLGVGGSVGAKEGGAEGTESGTCDGLELGFVSTGHSA